MHTSIAPTATTGKTMSSMTTLPSLSWLGHKLMLEILAFSAKGLFEGANILVFWATGSKNRQTWELDDPKNTKARLWGLPLPVSSRWRRILGQL